MSDENIRPNPVKPGPILHERLSPVLVARITHFRYLLSDVCPRSTPEWLDIIRRDPSPESKVLSWERTTRCYLAYCGTKHLAAEQKRLVLGVIFEVTADSQCDVHDVDLSRLPEGTLKEISAMVTEQARRMRRHRSLLVHIAGSRSQRNCLR